MKKMYLSLFLTITTLTTSCMEQQRYWPCTTNLTGFPLTIFSQTPFLPQPIHTNTQSDIVNNQQTYKRIVDTNWPLYNKVMDMTYKRDQPVVSTNANDLLVPVYVQTVPEDNTTSTYTSLSSFVPSFAEGYGGQIGKHDKTTADKHTSKRTSGKKTLLLTKPQVQPNTDMQQLYDNAFTIIKNPSTKTLITLITDMNTAKNKNIDEDVMGKYSYDKWLDNQEGLEEKMVLFFGYLKHYNLTVNNTKEPLPNNNELSSTQTTNNRLAKILDLPSSANTNKINYAYDPVSVCRNYPAFYNLESYASKQHRNGMMKNFLFYVYSNKEIPQNDYLPLSYANLKDKFYKLTYPIVLLTIYEKEFQQSINSRLYDVIKIIEAGTTLIPEKQEYDFGYDIIESELTTTEKLFTFLSPVAGKIHNTFYTKKLIGILCLLIKKYNNQRKDKKTPTYNQFEAYNEFRYYNSDFALPDSCDNTLFNKTIYAFDEFKELIDNIRILTNSSDENIQECIDQFYPPRK